MQLGNDIVDLKVDAEIHPRFLDRILHPVERILYAGMHEPRHIWRLWAAKEAAFKAHRQGPDPVGFFIPSRWLVDFQLSRVSFGDEEYRLTIEETEDYLHAIAQSEGAAVERGVSSGDAELSPEASRELARRLRDQLGITQTPSKDAGGIPRLSSTEGRQAYSLSHHGRHVAVVLGPWVASEIVHS